MDSTDSPRAKPATSSASAAPTPSGDGSPRSIPAGMTPEEAEALAAAAEAMPTQMTAGGLFRLQRGLDLYRSSVRPPAASAKTIATLTVEARLSPKMVEMLDRVCRTNGGGVSISGLGPGERSTIAALEARDLVREKPGDLAVIHTKAGLELWRLVRARGE